MPFAVADTINALISGTAGNDTIKLLVGGPFSTAITLAVIAIIIIALICGYENLPQLFLWICSATLGVIFLHDKIYLTELSASNKFAAYDDAIKTTADESEPFKLEDALII